MSALRIAVRGIGLIGPGLPSWAGAQAVLRGDEAHVAAAPVLAPPARLPPAERRRAGPTIRLAMAVADEAVAQAGIDPANLATVFAASGGEGANCHMLCETLASADRQLSPTRFTNSVHNAAAGYWHIAVGSRAASTSLSAFDGSFSAGLVEAATQVATSGAPVLLVVCDVPYPEPLHTLRPLSCSMGVALLLAPADSAAAIADLAIEFADAKQAGELAHCVSAGLDTLRTQVPAGVALPLLELLARDRGSDGLVIDWLPAVKLRVALSPRARAS